MQDQKQIRRFKFDNVIDESSDQTEVFEKLKIGEMIDKVLQGFNSTVFAFGLTGSGKTFTIEGYSYDARMKPLVKDDEKVGIIPRLIALLFEKIKTYSGTAEYTVYVTFVQLYKENIYDLLNPAQKHGGLKMRWNRQDEFYVENLYSYPCYTSEEVLSHYHRGIKNKIMSSHNMNLNSSRSHCIFGLTVEALDKTGRILKSKFQIVDLAGSEKVSQTGNEGLQLKESIEINKALFTLRQVITNLSGGDTYVPYRDSKLTSLLKQSIGGNSYCLMIACLSPIDDYLEDNISTLEYATKTGCISNEPVKNVDPKTRVIKDLKNEVKKLKKDLVSAEKHIDLLTQMVTMDRPSQLAKLKEIEAMPIRSGHIQRIKDLRTTIEDSKGKHQKIISSPINIANDNSKINEAMQIIKDLRLENSSLKQALTQKNYNSHINSYEITQLYNENRKLHEKVELLEKRAKKTESKKETIATIYTDKANIEPSRLPLVPLKNKLRRKKTPVKTREDYWMYSEKKASITQPLPESSQTTDQPRPITQEFPQSKEDAIKALSQLLLIRAKNKSQTS
jgi:Kinesin motor domain